MAKGKRLMAQRAGHYRYQGTGKPGKRLAAPPRSAHPGVAALAAVSIGALALTGAVELSAAYLMTRGSVDNAFVLGTVAPSVVETFDPATGVKENVSVKNNGNAPVYIRALVLVTWQDKQGSTMLSPLPEIGTDYEITGAEADWIEGSDGYFYYTQPVQPGQSTAQLVQKLTDKNSNAERQLSVDIIAQAVQAAPAQAVTEVFRDVTFGPDGITLVPPSISEGGTEP